MLVVAESDLVKCGAIVGCDDTTTLIVFHPALSAEKRNRLAQELLGEEEWVEWRMRAA